MDPEAERPRRKPQWLNQIKDWLSVSEPSAQAMKEQRDRTYKKFGVDAKDPRAAAKLHLPIGKIPSGAHAGEGAAADHEGEAEAAVVHEPERHVVLAEQPRV
ncbi:unnamed protein product [Clonostachys rosea f. rosea IK726]|nr:unnamed protein product [Clonostachys rosea f. rosea IK726]